jgi:hypothetical protein
LEAGIDQLADRDLSQIRTPSKFADFSDNLIRLLSLASVGWNQLRNRNSRAPRDPDRLALGDSFQQAVEMGFGVKYSHGSLVSHMNYMNYHFKLLNTTGSLLHPPRVALIRRGPYVLRFNSDSFRSYTAGREVWSKG